MSRESVDRVIADEERTLAEAASLLQARVPWDRWPDQTARALALALADPPGSESSVWQARVLRRHLFGPQTWRSPLPVPAVPAAIEIRRSERLRSDLPRIVRLRAGRYLIEPVIA
jgi:hypothetical protein